MDASANPGEDGGESLTPREAARDSVFVGATIRLDYAQAEHSVRIRNISSGGMMIDFPEELALGSAVHADIKGVGPISGTVVWSTEKHLGIRFASLIDPAAARIRTPPAAFPGVRLPPVAGRRPGLAVR